VLSRRAGSSGISWRIHSLVKKTLHRHRTGFEPQRASPFMKRVKAPPNTRRSRPSLNDDPSLCATPIHCWWCLRALPAAINTFVESFHCSDHHPHQDWGRARTAGNRFARDVKEPGPSWRTQLSKNGLVKQPRRDTRALSPAGMFGEKAPLRLATPKRRLHALSVPMCSAPAYFICKWGV
jgi:hypothetical protein